MNLRWCDRDWLDADDPAGWWYIHRDAAWLLLGAACIAAFMVGLFVGVSCVLIGT